LLVPRTICIIEIRSVAGVYNFYVFNLMTRKVITNVNANNSLITTTTGDNTLASTSRSPLSVQLQKSCVCSEHLNSRTHTPFKTIIIQNQKKVRHQLDPCRIKNSCWWRYGEGECRGVERFTTWRVLDKNGLKHLLLCCTDGTRCK